MANLGQLIGPIVFAQGYSDSNGFMCALFLSSVLSVDSFVCCRFGLLAMAAPLGLVAVGLPLLKRFVNARNIRCGVDQSSSVSSNGYSSHLRKKQAPWEGESADRDGVRNLDIGTGPVR